MRLIEKNIYKVLLFVGPILLVSSYANTTNLWQGEEIRQAAGYPAIVKFVKGDADKPLMVFIPGAHHSARIAYGGHKGSNESDFLGYWLNQEGYNFLAISYPIETKSKAMEGVYPDYSVRDWGQQAAKITKQIVEENNINGKIVVLGWSMAGKVAQPFYETAKSINLDLDFYVSLAATPPIPGIITMNKQVNMARSGLADRSQDIPKWFAHIKYNRQDNNGRTLIPWNIFESEYTGNISIQQQAYGLRYKKGEDHFIRDHWADMQDTKGYEYSKMPLVAMITPNSSMDVRHTLTDTATWNVYNANKVFQDYGKQVGLSKLPNEQLTALKRLTEGAIPQLSTEVKGNHFFFVGESGARETAKAVVRLESQVHSYKSQLSEVLGITIK